MKQKPEGRTLAYRDALGRKLPERLSEYFDFERWPEKADLKVTRHELSVILTRHYQVMRDMRWHRRLWRFVRSKVGSGPVYATTPTAGEKARGEVPEEAQ